MQTLAQLQRRRQPGLRLLWTAIQPAAAADAPQLTSRRSLCGSNRPHGSLPAADPAVWRRLARRCAATRDQRAERPAMGWEDLGRLPEPERPAQGWRDW